LQVSSQIALDKIASVSTSKVGQIIGQADAETMRKVTLALTVLLEIV
jgi:mRNA-degrading endonuclease toxin of MazEF toxin-antitoxin module